MASLVKGWGIQTRVIKALMIRELSTRFGRENIGFLWMMVEPLLFPALVAIIWRLLKGPEEHGISVIAFRGDRICPSHPVSPCRQQIGWRIYRQQQPDVSSSD